MSTEDDGIAVPTPTWWLFRGTGRPMDPAARDAQWPPPPPWRDFKGSPLLPPPPDDDEQTERRLGRQPSQLLDPVHVSL
nr:hypothetical protein [Micromonospora sp. DSM 115978]